MKDNMDREKLDQILSRALTQKEEPSAALQRRILGQWKEKKEMNTKKRWTAAAAVATCVLAVTVSVGAANHYLSSSQVADELGQHRLAEAFSGEDALEINETKSYGEYNVTFMGVTSGESLGETELNEEGELEDDKTYAVIAIEKADGSPMPDGESDDEDFFVSPLIQGYDPFEYNAVTMHGACTWTVIDGVQYRIAECDNVEYFADHKLYLCVMDTVFYSAEAYDYNDETGDITVNEDYDGMNLLFDLPIDASKADEQKAAEYLQELADEYATEDTSDDSEDAEPELEQSYLEYMQSGEWKEAVEGAVCVAAALVEQSENGSYQLEYQYSMDEGETVAGTVYFYEEQFVDGAAVHITDYGDYTQYDVAELNEDGTCTISVYCKEM